MTVFDVGGRVLLGEERIGNVKYEGVEFVRFFLKNFFHVQIYFVCCGS